jgi:hypothetical protein
MWTIEDENGGVLARFDTEELAFACFHNPAALARIQEDFKDAFDPDYCSMYLTVKHNGVELVWH